MTLVQHANRFLRPLARRYIHFGYQRKLHRLKAKNPSLFHSRPKEAERKHFALWQPLKTPVPMGWYRFFANLSDKDDPHYVPDNVYHAIIERVLNDLNYAWVFADKNFYQRHFNADYFPQTYLRNLSGTWLDEDFRVMTEHQARDLFFDLPDRLIVKPSIDSCSGNNVRLLTKVNKVWFCGDEQIDWSHLCRRYGENWLIQEAVSQHADLQQLNPSTVNTLRVFTYRSVASNKVHVMTKVLRMGRGRRQCVDNMNAGGVVVGIDSGGRLTALAIDEIGRLYKKHPTTAVNFENLKVPHNSEIDKCCVALAEHVHTQRTLSFDVCIREGGTPCVIEINTSNQGAHLSQFFNPPLFGYFTEEVIQYAAENMHKDNLKLFRLRG